MNEKANVPTGERILSLLIDLYADQMSVKVKYAIVNKDGVQKGKLDAEDKK